MAARSNPRRTNGTKRDKVRATVLREESDCYLCGQPVDKQLRTPHPLSPEVHEVMPVSKGGDPYNRGNCHLTHRRCNRAQGNRMPARSFETLRYW